ncbi:MAG: spore germination protein [Mycoplasmatota bacterium]
MIIDEIKKTFKNSSDLKIRTINFNNILLTYIFLESVSSEDKISDFFLKSLSNDIKFIKKIDNLFLYLYNTLPSNNIKIMDLKDAILMMPIGFTLIITPNTDKILVMETRSNLNRSISESTNEVVLRGPKDSFNENVVMNMGLLRRRIKSNELIFKDYILGSLTNTRVTIGYMDNIVDKKKLNMVLKRIESINVESIIDSGYIRKLITKKITTFPKVISTERPDLVAMHLLKGKIAIIVENSPIVLIIPGYFIDFFNNPEDQYALEINSFITKSIRIFAFLITLLTPALYITIAGFNRELIPIQLLISLAAQVEQLAFPIYFEISLLVIIFEILRESYLRSPSKMGSSISIVGGLILGDAAVSAGFVSLTGVIIVAITSISGLLFSDIDFINALRFWRFLFIIGASICGLFGISIVALLLIINLLTTKILNKSYLLGGN